MFGLGKSGKTNKQHSSNSPAKSQPQTEDVSGMFARLKAGLQKTRGRLQEGIATLVLGEKTLDADLLEDIETQLLSADLGLDATEQIITHLKEKLDRKRLADGAQFLEALKQELLDILAPSAAPLQLPDTKPCVILMVGVNGVGKTTTIGKLAKRFQGDGKSVMLAAGDTFRAAAVEQLQVWGERNDVPVVAQHSGADSASVIFDAFQSARARQVDVLLADTAGRLHNKDNLMSELEKIARVLHKQDPRLPDEILLVLDATTGQNALAQAENFNKSIKLTGLVLTKLDGTARGGVVFAISKKLGLPIRFIGVGEKVDDLRPFNGREFVDALFAE